jgi:hypothetical protein
MHEPEKGAASQEHLKEILIVESIRCQEGALVYRAPEAPSCPPRTSSSNPYRATCFITHTKKKIQPPASDREGVYASSNSKALSSRLAAMHGVMWKKQGRDAKPSSIHPALYKRISDALA